MPPRTVASTTAAARHREVRREVSPVPPELPAPPDVTDSLPSQTDLHPVAELSDANFSDDSLEGVPPPPPPRGSIAWEVPLDDEHALYTPGSTKVIGRRRRRSTDRSSQFTHSLFCTFKSFIILITIYCKKFKFHHYINYYNMFLIAYW